MDAENGKVSRSRGRPKGQRGRDGEPIGSTPTLTDTHTVGESTPAKRRNKLTRDEIRELTEAVSVELAYPGGERVCRTKVRTRFGVTRKQVDRVIEAVFRDWRKVAEADAKTTKAQAVYRLTGAIREARAKGRYRDVAAMETQLAKIQGTEAPEVKVHIAEVGPALAGVLAGMDVGTLEAMARQYDELEAAAKAAKALPAPARAEPEVLEGEIVDDTLR